jgi:hypothetical protein
MSLMGGAGAGWPPGGEAYDVEPVAGQLPAQIVIPPVVDRLRPGGLMRCCTETVGDLYPDGPAALAAEGQTLQCKYNPDEPEHRMIFRDGAWEWDHE